MTANLDDIPADTTIEMTLDLIRAFKSGGCHPACHNCGEELVAGKRFKLAYVKDPMFYAGWTLDHAMKESESTDEMLCDECTADDLMRSRLTDWEAKRLDYDDRCNRRGRHRGYTRRHTS